MVKFCSSFHFESVIEKLDLIALYLSFCFSYFNLLYPNLISAPISIILFQLLNTLYIIAMWEVLAKLRCLH